MKFVSPGYFGAIGTRADRGTRHHVERHLPAHEGRRHLRELRSRGVGLRRRGVGPAHPAPAPGTAPPLWREIVGVVQDVHEDALHQPAPTMVYWPVLMDNFGGQPLAGTRAVNLVIRSDQAGTESLLCAVESAVWSVNANMPVFLVRTMKDLYDDSMARTSFALVMLAIAGAMALGLGLVGIYGVIVVCRLPARARNRHPARARRRAGTLQQMFVRHGLDAGGDRHRDRARGSRWR